MHEVQILEAVERYLRNEMSSEERQQFEQLRGSNPEIDQLVVEHSLFLEQISSFGERKSFKNQLHEVHNQLLEKGEIREHQPKGKLVELWKRYKRVTAVAASIAGIVTILIAGMASYYSRKANTADIEQLRRDLQQEVTKKTNEVFNRVKEDFPTKAPENAKPISGGTGFLLDSKGYLVTNAHVVKGSSSIVVQNNKGQEFRAAIIYENDESDIAILRIKDTDFKPYGAIPYSFRKTGAELGEQIFTLGFPREEIVYNEGYMSAKTGFNGDTLSCQIGVSANPGNSGGPVFSKNGEVIGIVNTRQAQAEGVVFAITSKSIYNSLQTLRKDKTADTSFLNLKLPSGTALKGMERTQQIKKIEDCVFMVKSY